MMTETYEWHYDVSFKYGVIRLGGTTLLAAVDVYVSYRMQGLCYEYNIEREYSNLLAGIETEKDLQTR